MDLQSTKRQRKGSDNANAIPLEKHIESKRKELVTQRLEVPELRRKATSMREQASHTTKRWQHRMQKDLLKGADDTETEANVRESMIREHEYEKMVVNYLQLYHKRIEIGMNPNASKKKETIDAYVRQADLTMQRQSALVYEYLAETNESPPRVAMNVRDECPNCGTKLLLMCNKCIMACESCGYSVTYLDAISSNTSYDDSVEFSMFAYKRVNHFLSWLSHVQGKESHEVPKEIIEQVMDELYKQRLSPQQVTTKKVREALKTLKLRRCYDHVAQITSRISGIRPLRVSADTEETLKRMFLKMQPAFDKHAPKSRKNFLSYSYVLFRFFQLLNLNYMLPALQLLKGKEKLALQDEVFFKICKELGWKVNLQQDI